RGDTAVAELEQVHLAVLDAPAVHSELDIDNGDGTAVGGDHLHDVDDDLAFGSLDHFGEVGEEGRHTRERARQVMSPRHRPDHVRVEHGDEGFDVPLPDGVVQPTHDVRAHLVARNLGADAL